jgi:hypothetical protein
MRQQQRLGREWHTRIATYLETAKVQAWQPTHANTKRPKPPKPELACSRLGVVGLPSGAEYVLGTSFLARPSMALCTILQGLCSHRGTKPGSILQIPPQPEQRNTAIKIGNAIVPTAPTNVRVLVPCEWTGLPHRQFWGYTNLGPSNGRALRCYSPRVDRSIA